MFVLIARLRRRHRRVRKEKKQRRQQQQQQQQQCHDRVNDANDRNSAILLPSVRLTSRRNNSNSNSNHSNNNGVSSSSLSPSSPSSPPLGIASDVDLKMPLLYSFARGWAWEAVTYRCRTHPHEAAAVDYLGDSVLHWAAFGSAPLQAVQALLTAHPEAARTRNRSGQTPLHVACSYRASSRVLAALRQAYPAAVNVPMHPHNSRATPLHCLCDYGGSTYSPHHHSGINNNNNLRPPEYDSVQSLRILLMGGSDDDEDDDSSALPTSINLLDELYQRRPLEILNARKNLFQEQYITETIQNVRTRQRALREEQCREQKDWQEHSELQLELLDRWEDDLRQYRYTEFWQKASLLMVAEYQFVLAAAQQHISQSPRLPDCFRSTDPHCEDERCIKILHAAVGNPHCPVALQHYAMVLYEPYLSVPAVDQLQRLPLHVAAAMLRVGPPTERGSSSSSSSSLTQQQQQLVLSLIRACPMAAHVRDGHGQFPLDRALQPPTSARWSGALQALVDANPMALLEQCRGLGLLHYDNDGDNNDNKVVEVDHWKRDPDDDGALPEGDGAVVAPGGCLHPYVFARLSPKSLFPLLQANPALLTRFHVPPPSQPWGGLPSERLRL